MNRASILRLLRQVQSGTLSPSQAAEQLRHLPYQDLGFAKLDSHRALRKGFPEVVFCQGKTPQQVAAILTELVAHGGPVLATKATPEQHQAARKAGVDCEFVPTARAIVANRPKPTRLRSGGILILSAGTADIPVAEEAALTAEMMGVPVVKVHDVGVAGLHRLLEHMHQMRRSSAVVVVAGMEGALASVVGGLVDKPLIAVPTSVGYGASFGGLAALLTMLNSCAAGVGVVNIDNGFGGGYLAASIALQARRQS